MVLPSKQTLWVSGGIAGAVLIAAGIALYIPYHRLCQRVDEQLARGPFSQTINYYAAAESVAPGDAASIGEIATALKRAGYRDSPSSEQSWCRVAADRVEIHPAASAGRNAAVIFVQNGAVERVLDTGMKREVGSYELPPQLITNLTTDREERVMVRFEDLPPVLVAAITSAEDKRFFQHSGFDGPRIAKAMYVDVKDQRKEQGASTITMQLARNLYLDSGKRWSRKMEEFLITWHLEHALSKQKIFEYYSNEVFLGGSGTFHVNGFGEAARAYFNKDVRRIDLPEAALLAGLIQRPSAFNPLTHPERARERRNVVLALMHNNRQITDGEYRAAVDAAVQITPGEGELANSQYYVDLVSSEAAKQMDPATRTGVANVYTTIDLRLQAAAELALHNGMEQVDKLVARRKHRSGQMPQAALIALDPHTGEIKALVGGRNYSATQLNRVLAKRPPGSVFKPFVYAAALDTAVSGGAQVFSPSTTVDDSATTFRSGNQIYRPGNFGHEFHGTVTLRQALAKSMNVAAVKVAQMVGYENVVSLARRAGMNENIQPTPSVALGAYDVTPMEIARAYTIFGNHGVMMEPQLIRAIAERDGPVLFRSDPQPRMVLDPRVNFLMVDMLQDVLKYGTAAGVRGRGFTLNAAGKTGTSHDGWFAGFTSQLLCIVWVGFDDYEELGLEGAHSALPIWAEFMKAAAQHTPYRNATAFDQPAGIVKVSVDPSSGKLSTPFCTWAVNDYFVDGSQPSEVCERNHVPDLPAMNPVAILPTSIPTVVQ